MNSQFTPEELKRIEIVELHNVLLGGSIFPCSECWVKGKDGITVFVRGKRQPYPRMFSVIGTDDTMEIKVDNTTDYGTITITKKEKTILAICENCMRVKKLRYFTGILFDGWLCDDCYSARVEEE